MKVDQFSRYVFIFTFFSLLLLPMKIVAEPCPTFFLKTVDGEIINPLTGLNANKPYSTRQTCGTCHDYETIAKGYHFDMDWSTAKDDMFKDTDMPWKTSTGMSGSF